MEKLEFSTNWNNKLDCKCFTAIRIYNPQKHFKGNKFHIFLQKKYKAKAEILSVGVIKIDSLTDYICYLDTGYSRAETIEILKKIYPRIDFKNTHLTVLLLKKIELPKPKQETLFNC
ncbi:hypothetical protein FNW52_02975 [Flavobacterium sp. ZT3R18]|uniref:hypothetical protein n=1 Tax=Flavobacterium sp. ZT3R18 TaxID=2594429 RepID=UPI00117B8EB4|nr:hypothetical protein [Flavobacterium sp. ZT3R18]TRX37878.1 hypothetical protein FNW52_02975 [Flavobacterium sp. ZT3R18]